jgi:uncharacterized protein YecE (DUF72 family)
MSGSCILVGTAGWSYPDWENIVYPSAGSGPERLLAVARCLDCVEINSSFYRPPGARTTRSWLATLKPYPHFRLLAKAWQRFTHQRSSPWTQTEFELFTTGLAPLREADRLDALLFQFPWSFRNTPENRHWLEKLADAFADWPMAVELRHDSWLQQPLLVFLRDRHISFCNIDQPALSHCLPLTTLATTDIGYYRLHGRNAANWFADKEQPSGARYDYLYSETELDQLLRPICEVAAKTKRTFVIFNNHKDAKAFANALQLKLRIQPSATLRAPAPLRQKYPALQPFTRADNEVQLPLL